MSQLAIEVEIKPHVGDRHTEAMAEYLKADKPKNHRIHLCYCPSNKEYFVSRFFSKEYIINHQKSIKIIQ